MGKKTVLIITDGIGHKPNSRANAFLSAKKPTYDQLFQNTPHTLIATHGLSVGLPEGQMGNSEVGHMSLGSGRVLYQDLVKISLALENGSLAKSKKLLNFLESSNSIHIVGLMSDGGVHSHLKHILGVAEIAKRIKKRVDTDKSGDVWLHLITDGRDVSPTSAPNYLQEIERVLDDTLKIATIGGRFWTMDRDNRWNRIEKGFRAIYDATPQTSLSPVEYIEKSYREGVTDEFIEPLSFEDYNGIREGDGVIIINFRSDRVREITTALGCKKFDKFDRDFREVNILTMTQYDATFPYPVLFPKEIPKDTLAELVSRVGLSQFHTAETEKYAHVTFFFNGGVEEPFENETRVLIPSPKVKTYDLKPEMSASRVAEGVIRAIREGYDFVVVNFANGDMVGHTGNFESAIKAVESVDREIGKILNVANEYNYSVVITSDHGNCEEMLDSDGNLLTNHTVGDVWAFVVDDEVEELIEYGGLDNIAPTVLELMGIDVPNVMSNSLIKSWKKQKEKIENRR